jgi:prepilin-type N-terminal cleavage/methylation domain-containing protein/prepilin-type processing-associated H-X9-DG protein
MTKQARTGFTLVELLVVIGIIALLISILMPSLSRARASANLVACQSNFKQIYTALSFYANENKGMLPYSSFYKSDATANYDERDTSGTNARTFQILSGLLGTDIKDPYRDSLNKVFVCTEAELAAGTVWCPPMIRTITFHPRAMPGYDQLWSEKDNPGKEWPQRRLSSIRNSAEKIAFWEGPQIMTWNACPEPEALMLDAWRWSYGHRYRENIPSDDGNFWDENRRQVPVDIGQNKDDGWWVCSMRFRHMKNTQGPVAFWDGHVETRGCKKDAATGKDIPDVMVEEIRIAK